MNQPANDGSNDLFNAGEFNGNFVVEGSMRIYEELIPAGSVRLLGTSKDVHNEAIAIVLEDAVYRLDFTACKSLGVFSKEDSIKIILNVEIRINRTNHELIQSTLSMHR